jgi:hypothetical protein
MSTKSQKTEDMLDQTFANFDTEVTGAETQPANAGKSNSNESGKKTNMMLFIGAGVAAVLSVGYLFVVKPMLEPAPQPVKQSAIKPLAAAPEVTPTPAVDPLAQAQAAGPEAAPGNLPVDALAQPTDPLAQANQGSQVDPLAQANQGSQVDPLAQANQATVTPVETTPTQVDPLAQINQAAPVAVAVAGANVQSVAVVDELKSMFDKQSNEFKTVLTDIDTRVGGLENAVNEQKNVNSGFDQRITALEGGKKPVVNQVKKASVAKSSVVRAKKKAFVAKKAKNDAAVLVDKSTDTKPKAEKVEKAEKATLATVAIHSIYAGRLWVKNNDGSLSTFSAGEKLPTGEVIKSIDDENFSVTTDKRVIKN